MRGDIIIVEEHHRAAASTIVARLLPSIAAEATRYTITVSGESGSGKSETAKALQDELERCGVSTAILQQDDYFVHPPRTNHKTRVADIDWVGTNEVHLDLLVRHLAAAIVGAESVTKPLVVYEQDSILEEVLPLGGIKVVIAEGTYTALLKNVDTRVFIARNRLETRAARQQRAREEMDPFIEQVLEIEHDIIVPHREMADVVISRDYDVSFRSDGEL